MGSPSDSSASELKTNSRIRLYFTASDSFWIRATQAAMIEWRLDAHEKEFYVRSVNYQQKGQLIFEIEIKESAEKLWTEKRIADLILGYNPLGFLLIFKNATVEFAKEVIVPAAKFSFAVIVAVLVLGFILWQKIK